MALACAQVAPARSVEIRYRMDHIPKIASNQVAVWIESEAGAYVRTVFVTDFSARRQGFKIRPQALPTWVSSAGASGWSRRELDAVSGATPKPGEVVLVWDCRDERGVEVPDGVYRYRVEGNLYWDNTVLYTGRIRVGSRPDATEAQASYHPEDAGGIGVLVSEVRASYAP